MVLADRDGGVVLAANRYGGGEPGLLRIPAGPSDAAWWYQPGNLQSIGVGGPAPDGTIYVYEQADDVFSTESLVGLDGRTGQVKFRVGSTGRRHHRSLNHDWLGSAGDSGVFAAPMGWPVVGFDGAAYVATYSMDWSTDYCTDLREDHLESI